MFDLTYAPGGMPPADPKRAGRWKTIPGPYPYRAFQPVDLQDVTLSYTAELAALIGNARAVLSALSTRYALLSKEKQEHFQQLMVQAEVAASLKLAGAEDSKADEYWLEQAVPYSFGKLKELPLSRRLLEEIHDMALHDRSHYRQNPGEFRRSPVWLGKEGATLTNGASFVPPAPEDMAQAFSALEHYMNEEETTEPLVKAALVHYQFEMIHPFLDGNGRVGRILTLLCLKEAGILPSPILPLSVQLLNRSYYYFAYLLAVENTGAYEVWVRYFIEAILNAAHMAEDEIERDLLQDV